MSGAGYCRQSCCRHENFTFPLLSRFGGFPANGRCATGPAVGVHDADFYRLADEYLTNYLAWRPLEAVGLGFHEFDGKLTDFSQASIDGELARLKEFRAIPRRHLAAAFSSQAILISAICAAGIRREMFRFEEMAAYTRNPMTYAGALDVSPYIKRDSRRWTKGCAGSSASSIRPRGRRGGPRKSGGIPAQTVGGGGH